MSEKSILVIEDNAVNQKLVIRFLTGKGFRAVGANNTEEADRAVAAEQPGLILVDLSLPVEDGLSWVQRIRTDGTLRVPIVAVTAHAFPADRDRAFAAGCNDFITKPIDLKALLRLAEKYLRATAG